MISSKTPLYAIKSLAGDNASRPVLRIELRTSGCCDPTLALLFDQVRAGDLISEYEDLVAVMDPSIHEITGDVAVSLSLDGADPGFILDTVKPFTEWSGFSICTLERQS